MMKRLMLTCRDASKLLSKGQEQSLRFRERWSLKMHLFFCVSCRRYARQLRWMDQAFHLIAGKWGSYHMSTDARERIRAKLKKTDSASHCHHDKTGETQMNETTSPPVSLAAQLRQTQADFLSTVPVDIQEVLAAASASLAQSHLEQYTLGVGAVAPDFCLPNVDGKSVCLRDALAKGPVVISFYRGGWCPYCNLELRALQQHYSEISALGTTLLAISPQLPDRSRTATEEDPLSFEVLSDVGDVVARKFGLVYSVPETVRPIYQQWGIDLPVWNGDDTWELPMPATFVLDHAGTVRGAFVQMDYTQRMEPADIVAILRTL
ncbi:peroxiredoxin-like family protein [Acidithiobacillus ferriphilus]|uniref:peroxiredoxin-like family protein n=1 Tax=Acidithiobacillus ferriphilus TaxID=1689834 RepID=UPI001E6486C8|nr:peroxiredoxin-like family protein [Acidithiobacillus ferriphilus]UEP60143.1 AhpC/TSA family protein [Acidithiobacillus ferriphilus]